MKQNEGQIEVVFSSELKAKVTKILSYKGRKKKPIEVLIESGTYLGTGTTYELAEIIKKTGRDILFYTLEPKDWIYDKAKNNLSKYNFIQPLFAMSLNLEECLEFISNDEAIINHEKYPNLFIDCTKDPITMYRTEIWSCFSGKKNPPVQGMFYQLIPQYRDQNPLIVLDSCGGIGLLEFTRVMELMENKHFYLLCDDTNHLKNFRTVDYVKAHSDKWKILHLDNRCLLAEFLGE